MGKYYGYIYQITNMVNNKKYIGQHKVTDDKLDESYFGGGINITRAVQKYGKENFTIDVLEWVEGNKKNLDSCEIFWISKLDAVNSSEYYNIAYGGQGGAFAPYDEKRKQHLRDSQRKYSATHTYPAWKKLKQSKTLKQHYIDHPEEKLKFAHRGSDNGFYGKHHTEHTKQIIRDNIQAYKESHGGHGWGYGVPKSESYKQKMSNSKSKKIILLDSNNDVLAEFKNARYCGKYLGVSSVTVTNYVKSKKLFNRTYLIVREER